MKRKIIQIDSDKCNGCGICVTACHEGAITLENGKAVLLREDYCDGLGDCLPTCPTGAISFIEKETLPYDEEAVKQNMLKAKVDRCPGSQPTLFSTANSPTKKISSELRQWPVQIQLAPTTASYFDQANLLIAADCSAFAYGNFHQDFMKDHITLIGCPKLDPVDYQEKLTELFSHNNIAEITVVRMEVPCCGGLSSAVIQAIENSQKKIPYQVAILSTDGKLIERRYFNV